jgi:hypothetical protein
MDFLTDFHKVPSIKFHRNLSSRSHTETCRETDRQMNMTRVIGACSDYVNKQKTWKFQ